MAPTPPQSSPQSSVLIVDDHELIRQGLTRAFERAPGFSVAGEAGSLAQAKSLASTLTPDVVVTDLRLPDGSGIELVRHVRQQRPHIGIVVLTMYAGDEQLFEALEAGASAFVAKDAPSDDVIAAARHASVSPQSFAAADLAGALRRRLSSTKPALSARETQVLHLLADGLGVAAIARQLFVSESTTKTHISNIYEKLGAANRAQAIMAAFKAGLLGDGKRAPERP